MKSKLIAVFLGATMIPSFALAQQTCEERTNSRVAGTLAGAAIGALLGNAVAKNDRAAGTIIGGIGGGVIGNQISKGDCEHAYGYYDNNRVWHANPKSSVAATGYYDRNGNWMNGVPNGYYDRQGHWIASGGNTVAAGYYDSNRRWVPSSSQGYYSENGTWVTGSATGHYDAQRRWVAGPVTGYYNTRGQWIATSAAAQENARPGRRPSWIGDRDDTRGREIWFDQGIRRSMANRSITTNDGAYALRSLDAIRRDDEAQRRNDGTLASEDQSDIISRLDDLSREINR